MTNAERNAAIARKLEAYRAKFTGTQAEVLATLKREGLIGESLRQRQQAEYEAMRAAWAKRGADAA